jgi:hypothetical protein
MVEERDFVLRELRIHAFDVAEPTAANARIQHRQVLDDVLGRVGALHELADILYTNDGGEFSRQFLVLVQELLPERYLTLKEKFDAIDGIQEQCSSEKFDQYYRTVVKRDPAVKLHDAAELVFRAQQDVRQVGELDPLIHVMALVARDARDPDVARAYTMRAEDYASRIDEARGDEGGDTQLERLHRILEGLESEPRTDDGSSAYIVLRLDPWNSRPLDHFLLTSWLYRGDELRRKFDAADGRPLKLAEVELEAMRLINDSLEIADQWQGAHFSPVIEFILPRKQMNLAVESWSMEEDGYRPLGMEYVVVIRDLHRQKTATQRAAWRERWERIGDGSLPAEEVITKWIACSEQPYPPGELYRYLKRAGVMAAGLTFPPEQPIHEFRIDDLLNTGMPIAVWPHSCCHAVAGGKPQVNEMYLAFKEEICRLSQGHPIRELPEIIQQLRVDITDFGDATSGVALLWDDPSRLVRPAGFELSTPTGEGGFSE